MSVTGHKSESSLKTYSGKTCEKNKKFMWETISEKTLGKSSNTSNISEHDSLSDSIDFLVLSQSNITVEVDENTGASTSSASSFELQALSNSQTENVLKNLLPDNDGFDDLIKVLDIPQQHQNNVANRSSQSLMNQLPAPFVNNCQNITINYNIFQRQWILPFSDFLKLIIRLSYKWKHYFNKVTEERSSVILMLIGTC